MSEFTELVSEMEMYAILLAVMHEDGAIDDDDYLEEMAEVQAVLDWANNGD